MTSLIDLQPSFVLLVAPVAVRSTRLSQFQTMNGFYRLYAHCHSVKVSAVGIREKIKLLTQQEVEKICAHRTATDN